MSNTTHSVDKDDCIYILNILIGLLPLNGIKPIQNMTLIVIKQIHTSFNIASLTPNLRLKGHKLARGVDAGLVKTNYYWIDQEICLST